MNYAIERVPALDGYTVEWAEPGNYILSRRNRLYHSAGLEPPFVPLARIAAPLWKTIAASSSRLAQRLLRFMVTNVVPLDDGSLFITFDRSVGLFRDGKYRPLDGLVRPCRVLRFGCAAGDTGIFFGEYLANSDRGEMRIYKFTPGRDNLDVVHSFPKGTIRHIHGIYHDPFTSSLFCLTGDVDSESRIFRSSDEFQTLTEVGGGDETWRSVSMLFTADAMFYGMDAEYRKNNIFRIDRASGKRQSLGEVDGTVFYSKRFGSDLIFATTAEGAPSQSENVAAIWCTDGSAPAKELVRFNKDRWHKTLFMFGLIHFPYANLVENELYFSLVGLKGDNRTYRLTSR